MTRQFTTSCSCVLAPLRIFFKLDITTYMDFAPRGIIQSVCFIAIHDTEVHHRSSSFFRCGVVTFTCAVHPNTRKCPKCGFFPFQASNRVWLPITLVDNRFKRYTASHRLPPKSSKHIDALEQGSSHVHHRSFPPLHHTILLWSIWGGVVLLNPSVITQPSEIS